MEKITISLSLIEYQTLQRNLGNNPETRVIIENMKKTREEKWNEYMRKRMDKKYHDEHPNAKRNVRTKK